MGTAPKIVSCDPHSHISTEHLHFSNETWEPSKQAGPAATGEGSDRKRKGHKTILPPAFPALVF